MSLLITRKLLLYMGMELSFADHAIFVVVVGPLVWTEVQWRCKAGKKTLERGGCEGKRHQEAGDDCNGEMLHKNPKRPKNCFRMHLISLYSELITWEPTRDQSSIPTHRKDERKDIDRDHHRSRYTRDGGSNRNTDQRSYNDRRHDDYRKREKYADEDHKNFHKLSPHARGGSDHSRREFEKNRSRDNVDKYSRDGSGNRSSRDRHKKDDNVRDEKRFGHHHKDSSWRDSKDLDDPKYTRFEKGKSYDQETRGLKDRYAKEPRQLLDDESVVTAKKSKFSMSKDTEYAKDVNEVQSSSSKQVQEVVGKSNTEQDFVKDSDIDAAKVAAMKAAELVNRNLIGTGIMSTDQKKKLLWGSKKSTPTEEAAHRWDTSMFSDRERQEKFNKLMGVKGEVKVDPKPEIQDSGLAEKQKELQIDLEKQYTAGLRRRDGRTVGLGL
ncbi:hypothetical protein E3N88_22248 [Mikania micrantha]|uniref:Small acidic protein-like domain-containing protein n=1 Tax=Mikania micrantha TaxID=192012 RepID=A0A5N6NBJ7_9ASTR|nr:hypothetical protein E3N88_22248 [Mikania micrantha]